MELLKLIVGELKGKKKLNPAESAEVSDKKAQLKEMIAQVKSYAEEECGVDAEELASMIAGESPEQEITEMESEDESESEEAGPGVDKKAMMAAMLKAKMKKMGEGYEG